MTAGRPEGATRGESKDSRGSGNGKIVTEDTEDADTRMAMMMIRMMMCAGARGGPWLFILLGERNPAAGRRTATSKAWDQDLPESRSHTCHLQLTVTGSDGSRRGGRSLAMLQRQRGSRDQPSGNGGTGHQWI